ncbi:hypothetical protein QTP70_023054 [Hemibagrus guttatus]|uniref:ribonuclease H n=1 Tax=Hemibagrus guttatus TaxID=175788 RepID=A0AAE0RH84_9TELE|nr:hypothetical protein QTP70_023054 [Hemibagrus guttatus]
MRIVSTLNFIPDRSRPGLKTTAIGAIDLQGAGGNWGTVGRRSRGGRRVHRQREKRKGKSVGLRIGTLNVGTMTGKGRELADMMERRKVDILCVKETWWKGSKARGIGAGFKLFYYGVDSKRNGVGVVLKEEFVRNVLEVKRVSDRAMSLKLEIEGVMLNVVSGYAPQVGCELEKKERFWSKLDEVMESIPMGERMVIGADFNPHVCEGNTGDEEVMGKFGVKERNLEGQMVVDFAKRMDMAVVNTYFQKMEEHRVTYKSGGRSTQVDYILCRRGNLKEISDCKVVVGESVARQHRMVVCRMTLMVCKKKRSKVEIEKKTKWWKLKKEECCEEFRQKLRQALGGQVVLPDDWETTAEVIRETGRKVLGVSSRRRKVDKETWWWNEEVQDSIQRKRLAKKKWDMDRTEENRQEYKDSQRRVKREVSKAKQKAYDELYTRLDTREGEKDLYRVVEARLRKVVEICEQQHGFMPRKSTTDVIFALRILMEKYRDGQRELHCLFVDLEKAYDRVPREELCYCMRKSGVAEKYVRVVQDMYERSRTVVRCAVGKTEEFNVEVGLHQGSALSPFLFAMVMDQLSEEVIQESPWTIMFADDIVICSESREQVEVCAGEKRNESYFRMLDNARLMQTREAVVDVINGRSTQYEFLVNPLAYGYGLDKINGEHFHNIFSYICNRLDYPDQMCNYVDLTDDDDDDDDNDEYGSQNNRYCGFTQNFLDKGITKHLSAIKHYKTAKRVTSEEAAKIAKELVAEEEKLKKKAEKKKQKKMRQRERRRLEKLEKENGNKDGAKQDAGAAAAPASVKSKPTERQCENEKKKNNSVPPDPGPQCNSIATESSDSCDDFDDDDDDYDDNDKDSVVDELELDMSSCFVTNAAAIAKRKLEQKPKSDWKKVGNLKKQGTAQKREPQIENVKEKEASEEPIKDNVTKSMELAVLGNKYAQTGNLDMAVKYFTDAIKHNPQEAKLFGNRSFCYEKMQQYEKALIDADIALSLNHSWIKGLYRKGKALVGLKRYYEACLTYKEVLKLDSSCTDAAQELMRVQIMQLMDMGYTREQSSNALIIHGTVEKALEALSGLHGNMAAVEERVFPERNPQPAKVPLRTVSQNPPKVNTAVSPAPELFPVWVGDLVPALTELRLNELFSNFGPVHSARLLSTRRCAFINYTNKEHSERAIKEMHGFRIAGTCLAVRYPDRIHTHLGVSKTAATDTGKVNKFPDECYFWRTTGCIKNNRCPYRHVPEHKGIDRPKVK